MPLERVLERISLLKKKLDSLRPLSSAESLRLKEHLVVEWTHHSTALEGNTLNLQETRLVLLDGLTVGGKTLREHLEVVDHRDAVEWLEDAVRGAVPLTEGLVREVHRLVLKSTLPKEAGKYRRGGVRIAGSRHVPPPAGDVPSLVQGMVEVYNSMETEHPVKRAAWLHWRLVWIHPFVDGNGRTARLLMNFSLMKDGYPPAIIRKEQREHYLDALETASLKGDLEPFIRLVAGQVEESLHLYLEAVGIRKPN
ncbi:MAG TPA: Fic family protein [Peptococcaceae bacterium]|nr:Fic family protein [Peptococcaceae bacterium]